MMCKNHLLFGLSQLGDIQNKQYTTFNGAILVAEKHFTAKECVHEIKFNNIRHSKKYLEKFIFFFIVCLQEKKAFSRIFRKQQRRRTELKNINKIFKLKELVLVREKRKKKNVIIN